MTAYKNFNKNELENLKKETEKKFNDYQALKLELDMSRGKPNSQQLDIVTKLFDQNKLTHYLSDGNIDVRNYGALEGIKEARELFAKMLEVENDEIIIGGNSSLNLMYDMILRGIVFGVLKEDTPWKDNEKTIFLCPSPGYDRHFAICEILGIEMITISMNENGPDMDAVEEIAGKNENVKGMWCVPKYSNPDGITYSDETVKRLASMKTAAKDFRLFWDNAYAVHHLYDNHDKLLNILDECRNAGNPDRAYVFASTSKITYPGAGISMIASSKNNIGYIKSILAKQTISYDKLNQLRHVKALKSMEDIQELMKEHAKIIRPKFELVINTLEKELKGTGIAKWSTPKGGYFISLYTLDNCAKRVVKLAEKAGVKLTSAGATYPYQNDPGDRNIRIAPTYPSYEDLKKAIEIVCVCVKLASLEKLLEN